VTVSPIPEEPGKKGEDEQSDGDDYAEDDAKVRIMIVFGIITAAGRTAWDVLAQCVVRA
jgi:hypothetical protein